MKKILITGVFTAALLWSCGNTKELQEDMKISGFNLNDTTAIAINDIIICNDDVNLFVQFDTVYSDSRCPIDANCIWEGNAEIGLSITYNKELDTMRLSTNQENEGSKSIFGYEFHLLGLDPYPGTPNAADIRKQIKLKVTKG